MGDDKSHLTNYKWSMEEKALQNFPQGSWPQHLNVIILNTKVAFLDITDGLFLTTFLLLNVIFVKIEIQVHRCMALQMKFDVRNVDADNHIGGSSFT